MYSDHRLNKNKILNKVKEMLDDGADIIDLGGESTRPGAEPVSVQEEQDRLFQSGLLRDRFDAIYSVDTSTPAVMTAAADNGAHLINDVRALQREGAHKAASLRATSVSYAYANQPDSMQQNPQYQDVVNEVMGFLQRRQNNVWLWV